MGSQTRARKRRQHQRAALRQWLVEAITGSSHADQFITTWRRWRYEVKR